MIAEMKRPRRSATDGEAENRERPKYTPPPERDNDLEPLTGALVAELSANPVTVQPAGEPPRQANPWHGVPFNLQSGLASLANAIRIGDQRAAAFYARHCALWFPRLPRPRMPRHS